MSAVRVIVCERRDLWAPALRAALGEAIAVRSVRSLTECDRELDDTPGALVAAELTADAAGRLCEFIGRLGDRRRSVRVIALAERALAEHEWRLREAGAVHFETSPRRLAALAALVARQRSEPGATARSTRERIWARLPWPGAGGGTFTKDMSR